jgi:LAO/AO transport system kinase
MLMTSNDSRVKDLTKRVLARDVRAISRALTLVENASESGILLHQSLYPHTGNAFIVGITGSPGAGKSSLVNELALSLMRAGERVAVLAVDPSSPYSGGAVLGDRIRMEAAVESDKVYVRSMASRGALGGLSGASADAVDILDAAGFSYILVETVGVGQGEVDIARTAHCSVVVLVPGMGDEVQVMKAGILEIADVFVINKSDRPGVHALERELRILMTLITTAADAWKVPIIRTIATKPEGIKELIDMLNEHRTWLKSTGKGEEKAKQYIRERILQLCTKEAAKLISNRYAAEIDSGLADCLNRKRDPRSVAIELVGKL